MVISLFSIYFMLFNLSIPLIYLTKKLSVNKSNLKVIRLYIYLEKISFYLSTLRRSQSIYLSIYQYIDRKNSEKAEENSSKDQNILQSGCLSIYLPVKDLYTGRKDPGMAGGRVQMIQTCQEKIWENYL